MAANPQYFNRELSWLEFNQRVLDQAIDDQTPLLERLKFFCSKHELLLCSMCAVKRHRSCDEILTITGDMAFLYSLDIFI